MKNWRTTTFRAVMHRNRFLPLSGRFSRFAGHVAIPDGFVVNTRYGVQIRVHSNEMYRNLYLSGVYEPFHTKIFSRIVKPGTNVLDIGTNFGWYAALFSKWVGSRGFVHAFEPVPFICEYAEETLRLNECGENVRLNRCALGAKRGKTQIYTFLNLPHGHACISDLGRKDALPHKCEITTLDEYVETVGLQNCLFMKIDVEGHELEVFHGGPRFLKADMAPIIGFEVNASCLSARCLCPDDLMDCLRSYGYTNFYAFSVRTGIHKAMQLGTLIDYLAVKPARVPDVTPALQTGRILL